MSASTETDILEGLDFTIELPCEHPNHSLTHSEEESAAMLLARRCPGCGETKEYLICASGYARITSRTLEHRFGPRPCGFVAPGREWVVKVTPL